MAIAWACEEHNALQAEAVSYRQKQRQMVFAARNFQIVAAEAEEKMLSSKQQIDLLIRLAMDEISAAQQQVSADEDSPRCFDIEMPLPQCDIGYSGRETSLTDSTFANANVCRS